MKTGELASLLGYSDRTLRNWLDRPEFEHFFTSGARGEGVGQRILTESDVLALNTIRFLRSRGTHWDEVLVFLKSGKRETEFPQNATHDTRTIPVPQAEQGARLMAVVRERDAALDRIGELQERLDALDAVHRNLQAEHVTMQEKYLREIADLNKRIGYLEGYQAALEKQARDSTTPGAAQPG